MRVTCFPSIFRFLSTCAMAFNALNSRIVVFQFLPSTFKVCILVGVVLIFIRTTPTSCFITFYKNIGSSLHAVCRTFPQLFARCSFKTRSYFSKLCTCLALSVCMFIESAASHAALLPVCICAIDFSRRPTCIVTVTRLNNTVLVTSCDTNVSMFADKSSSMGLLNSRENKMLIFAMATSAHVWCYGAYSGTW